MWLYPLTDSCFLWIMVGWLNFQFEMRPLCFIFIWLFIQSFITLMCSVLHHLVFFALFNCRPFVYTLNKNSSFWCEFATSELKRLQIVIPGQNYLTVNTNYKYKSKSDQDRIKNEIFNKMKKKQEFSFSEFSVVTGWGEI